MRHSHIVTPFLPWYHTHHQTQATIPESTKGGAKLQVLTKHPNSTPPLYLIDVIKREKNLFKVHSVENLMAKKCLRHNVRGE
jgi:hypothetical protein